MDDGDRRPMTAASQESGDPAGAMAVPSALTPESIAEAAAAALPALGVPAICHLLQRAHGKEVHIVTGPNGGAIVKRGPSDRIRREVAVLRVVADALPGAAPAVLAALPAIDGFAMELLALDRWSTWENALIGGGGGAEAEPVGRLIARLHRAGRAEGRFRPAAEDGLASIREHTARTLLAAWQDDPPVRPIVAGLVEDVFSRRMSIAHGDLVLGNVMVGGPAPVLIDFEKSWFGDPSHDLGKLVGMAIGTQIFRPRRFEKAPLRATLTGTFDAWRAAVDWEAPVAAEARAALFAIATALAIARMLERRPEYRLPSLPAQIAAARGLLLGGVDRIAPIVEVLVPPDRA